MKVHYPKLYNMAHSLALNVLLLPKDVTIIFIRYTCTLNTVLLVLVIFFLSSVWHCLTCTVKLFNTKSLLNSNVTNAIQILELKLLKIT